MFISSAAGRRAAKHLTESLTPFRNHAPKVESYKGIVYQCKATFPAQTNDLTGFNQTVRLEHRCINIRDKIHIKHTLFQSLSFRVSARSSFLVFFKNLLIAITRICSWREVQWGRRLRRRSESTPLLQTVGTSPKPRRGGSIEVWKKINKQHVQIHASGFFCVLHLPAFPEPFPE